MESPTDNRPAPRSLRPTPTCCACIVHEGRLLMILRGQEPSKGQWSFPGGRIEFGETVFEAIKREVREEVGLEIEPVRVFQVYDWIVRDESGRITFHYLVNYVLCRCLSLDGQTLHGQAGEPRASSDALDVRWVSLSDLDDLTTHPFVRQTARRLLAGSSHSPDAATFSA